MNDKQPGAIPLVTLREWIDATLKKKDWSATRWAKEAGLSHTTITRFMSRDDFILTTKTITKLAGAANVPSPVSAGRTIPLYRYTGEGRRLIKHIESDDGTLAILITGDKGKSVGIMPNDYVVLDDQATPKNDDIVVVMNGKDVEVMRFVKKGRKKELLGLRGQVESCNPDDREIIGVAVALTRRLRQ